MPTLTPGRRRRRVRALPWASDARAWPLLRAPGRPRMGAGRARPDSAWLPLALLLGAAALAGFTLLRAVAPDAEGVMLQAARRVAAGEWPYRDFWLNTGPGQPLLLAALSKLFGPSLLWWRVVRVALVAVVALEAFALTRRRAPTGWALLAWAATAGALAWPPDPGPTPSALALCLGALLLARRSPAGSGVLAGLAAAFRPELGLAAALGLLVAAAPEGRRAGRRQPADRAGPRALAIALLVAVLAWAPFAIAAPRAVWDQTAGFLLQQRLGAPPFPLRYDGGLDLAAFLSHYLPLVLLAGLVVWLLAALVRRPTSEELALVPLAVAGAAVVLVRPDPLHVAVLAAVTPAMLALAGSGTAVPVLRAALAGIVGLVAVTGATVRADQALHPPGQAALTADAADGVRAASRDAAALNRLVPFVQARVPAGRPVFVAAPRHDRVRPGATLLYTLLDRPNATAYDPMRPGLVTTAAVQARMVAALRQARPRLVVRWSAPAATAGGAPSAGGATALDRYLSLGYRSLARFGDYAVLARAPGGGGARRP